MNVIKINGISLPGNIVTYKGTMIDVDGSGAGTTETGVTIRDVRRRNKNKIMLKLDGLTLKEFADIMSAINSPSFTVTFFCGSYKTITFYAGDKNWEGYKVVSENESRWRLEVNLIEY